MAVAKLAASDIRHEYVGTEHHVYCKLTWDGGTYETDGTELPKAALGLTAIDFWEIPPQQGYLFERVEVDEKIKVRFGGAPTAAHAHDLVFKANAAANAVTMAANSLRNASAGDLTVVGAGADGGIANNTVVAATAAAEYTNGLAISLADVIAKFTGK